MRLNHVTLTLILFVIASCGRYTEATSPCFGTDAGKETEPASLSFLAVSTADPNLANTADKDCTFSRLPSPE